MCKITIVGAGNVGASTALLVVQKELGDAVLIDVLEGIPQGKGLDMLQTGPLEMFDSYVEGTNDFSKLQNSDIVVVTAGIARKPGMSREDLLKINADIVKSVVENIKKYAPESIILMVTNPLDVMTYLAYKISGFPKNRVMGQAGVLDSARLKTFIAMELGVSIEDVSTMVLGGHGDTMVPLIEYTTVSGIPVKHLIQEDKLQGIVKRTIKGGEEIVGYLKTGSAYYAPAASTVSMVEAILKDKKRVLPVSTLLEGQYGINDTFIGVPVILGKDGVEKIIEIKLSETDLKALQKSAEFYRNTSKSLGY
ncbi:MAG: malate dehydrogenase [Candidatus Hydrogenedentota bacterium]